MYPARPRPAARRRNTVVPVTDIAVVVAIVVASPVGMSAAAVAGKVVETIAAAVDRMPVAEAIVDSGAAAAAALDGQAAAVGKVADPGAAEAATDWKIALGRRIATGSMVVTATQAGRPNLPPEAAARSDEGAWRLVG